MPQDFMEDPVEVLKRQIHISPFWEEDLGELAKLVGEDRVLFGSDFPHPEGLADPVSYVKQLDGVPEPVVRKIMGGNLARLLGIKESVH
jgi:predicted TIM-barrel fold metal-dependent hydrolase